jgi:hypothetical protein
LKLLIEYTINKKPQRSKPKLNNGATLLLTECPRSLNALFSQLNHGAKPMLNVMNKNAMAGPMIPNNA